jgi:hypothetical protein
MFCLADFATFAKMSEFVWLSMLRLPAAVYGKKLAKVKVPDSVAVVITATPVEASEE